MVSLGTEKMLKVDQVGHQLRKKICCKSVELNGSILADSKSVEKLSCFLPHFATNIDEQSLLSQQVKSKSLIELVHV